MHLQGRLLRLVRDSRLALALTVLSGLAGGFLAIGQAWFLSTTVSHVYINGQTLTDLTAPLYLLLAIILLRTATTWANEVCASAVAVRIKSALRQRLFDHILALGPAYRHAERSGELTATAVEGVEALDSYFSQYLPQLVIATLVPVSILIFVFPLDPLSGAILLLTAPLIPLFMVLIGKGAELVTKRQYEILRRLSAHFLDSLQGLTTLKLFGQSKAHARTITESSDQFREATLKVLRITFLSALALELIATLSTAVVAVEIGLRLLYARLEFQEALFLLVLAPEFYLPLRMLGLRFHAGMAGTSAAHRIFEILELPAPRSQSDDHQISPRAVKAFGEIRFKNVDYSYEPEGSLTLQGVNLSLLAGQHLALVGHSGAGKSTLVQLLLRFIRPKAGQISVDGHPVEEIEIGHWRDLIGWVPQKPYLFHDTIAMNIRLGRPNADDEEVHAAAKAAHLDEFILSLPKGYATVIGEGGERLSSGQAQRLALARAFLKNAPILILDEPTSSLDPENETLLEEATHRLMRGRTVLTIAHRLNTVFKADQIVVLEAGEIVEIGNHQTLLAKKGRYAALVHAYVGGPQPVGGVIHEVGNTNESVEIIPQTYALSPALPAYDNTLLVFPTTRHTKNIPVRLLGFLRGSWGWIALSVLLGMLAIGSSTSLMGFSAWLISAAALHPSIAALQVAIVAVRLFGILRGVSRYLERLVSHNVTFQILSRLRTWFYQSLEPLAPARLLDYRSGDLLSRVVSDVEALQDFYTRVVAPPLVALFITLGSALFLAAFDPGLGCLLLFFLLLLGLGFPVFIRVLSRQPGRELVLCRSQLYIQLVDGIQGMADLLAFDRAAERVEQIATIGQKYGRAQQSTARIEALNLSISSLLTHLGMWAVLTLAIPLVNSGQINGVMLATLALVTISSFEAVTPLPLAAQKWTTIRESAQRLFSLVDSKPAISEATENQRPIAREDAPSTHKGNKIQISGLTFTYPGSNKPALSDFNLTIQAGKSKALVGPSGAGKTTLVNLLLRFYEFQEGQIYFGGHPLQDIPQDEIRRRIAVISPREYFFNTTVRENLQLACPAAREDEIIAAAKQAQIHAFITRLPKGYDTFIGEQGLRLSVGERQRLAIARALLKQAPILVLDEPTANLDPLTEQQVLTSLFTCMQDRTALLITHRLVGLEHIDEIIVLDKGQIVAHGKHATLLTRDGLYQRMWQQQNRIVRG